MPLIRIAPGVDEKLSLLGQAARYDLACSCGDAPGRTKDALDRWIYPVALPTGGRVPMLKMLQRSGCERGCHYCVERHGGPGGQGLALAPEELANAFMRLVEAKRVFGLFLSSAIRGGAARTMDEVLATAELLRRRHRFRGFLHLKLLPGCRPDQVDRALRLATRVSVNLETPNAARLATIAPGKGFDDELLATMRRVAEATAEGRFRPGAQTSQLVVGASDETDREIGGAAARLYAELKLARVYYSAFQPVPGTPLEGRPPTPTWREHRLYQLDFLLRRYGFDFSEIPFDDEGGLDREVDPKTAWAIAHPERFPLEVNLASREELLRVPGIGPVTADRILSSRRLAKVRHLRQLTALGATREAVAPFVLLDGRRPPHQLDLFARRTG